MANKPENKVSGDVAGDVAGDEIDERWEYFKNLILADGKDATNRIIIRQAKKAVQSAAVAALETDEDELFRTKVAKALATPLGGAVITGAISGALMTVPGAAAEALAREARIAALVDGGDVVLDLVMKPLRELLCGVLKNAEGAEELLKTLPVGVPKVTLSRDMVSTKQPAEVLQGLK